MTRSIVTPEQAGDLIGLALADLDAGGVFESAGELETVVVVLSGVADVEAAGERLGTAGGRSSVFEGPGSPSADCHRARATRDRNGPGGTGRLVEGAHHRPR
jgi:5-deoxy-D-glucuronate isomerase